MQRATGETTVAKALMAAARVYPAIAERDRELEAVNKEHERRRDALRTALREALEEPK